MTPRHMRHKEGGLFQLLLVKAVLWVWLIPAQSAGASPDRGGLQKRQQVRGSHMNGLDQDLSSPLFAWPGLWIKWSQYQPRNQSILLQGGLAQSEPFVHLASSVIGSAFGQLSILRMNAGGSG